MKTTTQDDENAPRGLPLALHVRRLRQWHGTRGLTQAELARLAALSPRQVRGCEAARVLPKGVATLLRLALAFNVSLETLIAPHILEAERVALAERRRRSAPDLFSAAPDEHDD